MRRDPRPAGAVLPPAVRRPSDYDELSALCEGIESSFVHLETRDAYGTEIELPHMAKWRRGEPDDYAWLAWWLEMLRRHRAAGRTCRRARIVSEPLSDYQRWTHSHAGLFVDAGEDVRYVPRPRLTEVLLPGQRGLLRLRRQPGVVPALRRQRHQHRVRGDRRPADGANLPRSVRGRLEPGHAVP